MMKAGVRFVETPLIVPLSYNQFAEDNTHDDLLKALALDDSSFASEDKSPDVEESPSNERCHFVGRTPHAKVIQAEKSKQALNDLMNFNNVGIAAVNETSPNLPTMQCSVITTPYIQHIENESSIISPVLMKPISSAANTPSSKGPGQKKTKITSTMEKENTLNLSSISVISPPKRKENSLTKLKATPLALPRPKDNSFFVVAENDLELSKVSSELSPEIKFSPEIKESNVMKISEEVKESQEIMKVSQEGMKVSEEITKVSYEMKEAKEVGMGKGPMISRKPIKPMMEIASTMQPSNNIINNTNINNINNSISEISIDIQPPKIVQNKVDVVKARPSSPQSIRSSVSRYSSKIDNSNYFQSVQEIKQSMHSYDENSQMYSLSELLPVAPPSSLSANPHDESNLSSIKPSLNPWMKPHLPFDAKECKVGRSSTPTKIHSIKKSTPPTQRSLSLGSAQRVPKSSYIEDQEDSLTLTSTIATMESQRSFQGNVSSANVYIEETVDTDAAIATVEEGNTSFVSSADTTFTMDQSYFARTLLNAEDDVQAPRLAIKSMKRTEEDPFDIKEITFQTTPGDYTTVMLTFSNHRPKPMVLKSQAMFLRLEPLIASRDNKACLEEIKKQNNFENHQHHFTISPEVLTIPPFNEGILFITFSPTQNIQGIYSGAMRIKCSKKNFTMLLRGEASNHLNQSIANDSTPVKYSHSKGALHSISASKNQTRDMSHNTSYLLNTLKEEHSAVSHSDSMVSSSPVSMKAFQQKLNYLHNKINELSNKMNSNSSTTAVSSPPATTMPISISSDSKYFPNTLYFDTLFSKCEITVANPTINKKVLRLYSSSPLIAISETFVTISPQDLFTAQVHLDVNQEELNYLLSTYSKKEATIELGNVHVHYDHDLTQTLPVVINLPRFRSEFQSQKTLNHSKVSKSEVQSSSQYHEDSMFEKILNHLPSTLPSTREMNASNHQQKDEASFTSTIQSTASFQENIIEELVRTHSQSPKQPLSSEQEQVYEDMEEVQEHVETNKKQTFETAVMSTLIPHKPGVYFRKSLAQFGSVSIGSMVRAKIELCNATHNEVTVHMTDPSLPFIALHNEIKMRPKSFVRVPVRFVPVSVGEHSGELTVSTADGKITAKIGLSGYAYA